jgi:hypothetical protein
MIINIYFDTMINIKMTHFKKQEEGGGQAKLRHETSVLDAATANPCRFFSHARAETSGFRAHAGCRAA